MNPTEWRPRAVYNGSVKALLLILAIACGPFTGVDASNASGETAPPKASGVTLPVNSPPLSLAMPYAVFTSPDQPIPLDLHAPDSPPPPNAADYYAYWSVPANAPPGSIAAKRRAWNLRGRIITIGSLKEVITAGAAGDYPGIVLKPRLTGDAAGNRYRAGFELRLAADLVQRIPFPTLDLADLTGAGAGWIQYWIDECVRNGVAGVQVVLPADAAAAKIVRSALAPLAGPTVYLPPPSEVAILVPERSAEAPEVFRCYAGLRASGVWANFVSEEQITVRTVSLARFAVIICPCPLSPIVRRLAEDAARRGAVVVAVGSVVQRGARVLASEHDGHPLVTERRAGDGRWIAAKTAPWSPDGAWAPFWYGILSDAGVPRRKWIEAVTAGNAGRITGRYTKPKLAK